LPIRGRSYEVFNMEIVMLTVLSSLYVLSTMLWYNFLSLYLSSFFEVEKVGLLLSILTGGGMLSIILGGLLADSLGRRPAIAIAIIGVAVAAVALGFSRSFMVLALAILVFSLCSQSLRTIIRVFVAEKLPEEVRGRGLGVILTVIALVGAIAPTVGGYLVKVHGFMFVFELSAVIAIASLIPLLFVGESASRRGFRLVVVAKPVRALISTLGFGSPLLVYYISWCVYSFGTDMVIPYVSLFANTVLGFSVEEVGFMFTLALTLTIPAYYVGGVLADRLGYRLALMLSLGLNALLLTLMAYSSNKIMAIALWALASFVFMTHEAAEIALLVRLAPPEARSTAMSVLATLISLTTIPSPLVGGMLWSLVGPRNVYLVMLLLATIALLLLATITIEDRRS
jgi:MFS family permease